MMKKTLLFTIFLKVTHILTEETLLKNTDVDSLLSSFKVVLVVVQPPLARVTIIAKYGNHDVSIGPSSPLVTSVDVNEVIVI